MPGPLHRAFRALLTADERLVLAVSGGVDSMVLLHGAARSLGTARGERLLVATFDHGTGAHASSSTEHVKRVAGSLGVRFVSRRESGLRRDEASWREARWRFLFEVAAGESARVATAHTRDDQVETIVQRILRGSGARGLAALLAPSEVRRPLLDATRADILAFAELHSIRWCEDPTNVDRHFLRNRVRHDLLPAMRRVRPEIDGDLLALARRAADLRTSLGEVVDDRVVGAGAAWIESRLPEDDAPVVLGKRGEGDHRKASVPWSADACALYWQTVTERAGLALDWRGTDRLVRYGAQGRVGTRIPLPGGYEALRRRGSMQIRLRRPPAPAEEHLSLASDTRFGVWRFHALSDTSIQQGAYDNPWVAWLPRDGDLSVRAWKAGDRFVVDGSVAPRRVARFFSDARVLASDREGWPVVVADGEIVWIPGIRRGQAATARSGRPGVCLTCERDPG